MAVGVNLPDTLSVSSCGSWGVKQNSWQVCLSNQETLSVSSCGSWGVKHVDVPPLKSPLSSFSILLRIVGGETASRRTCPPSASRLSVSSCGSWGVKPISLSMSFISATLSVSSCGSWGVKQRDCEKYNLATLLFQYPLADRGG